mmetsp:Transcript_6622/g.19037  ORF Transcript_6622/g.19037 Transcript_6622/m.19037 type:complete len:209 (-) Transcript_6622:615-1241(-)
MGLHALHGTAPVGDCLPDGPRLVPPGGDLLGGPAAWLWGPAGAAGVDVEVAGTVLGLALVSGKWRQRQRQRLDRIWRLIAVEFEFEFVSVRPDAVSIGPRPGRRRNGGRLDAPKMDPDDRQVAGGVRGLGTILRTQHPDRLLDHGPLQGGPTGVPPVGIAPRQWFRGSPDSGGGGAAVCVRLSGAVSDAIVPVVVIRFVAEDRSGWAA